MIVSKNQYFGILGMVISISLAITVFGGLVVLKEIFSSDIQTHEPDITFTWTTNATSKLAEEMEEREANLSRVFFDSGELHYTDEKTIILKPLLNFTNDYGETEYTIFSAYQYDDQIWRVNLTGDISGHSFNDGYFYADAFNISEINKKFTSNLELLEDMTNETILIGSTEWRSLHLYNYYRIIHCYEDSSAVTLELLIHPVNGTIDHSIILVGSWEDQKDKLVFYYPKDMMAVTYEITLETHTPFELYVGQWYHMIKRTHININPDK